MSFQSFLRALRRFVSGGKAKSGKNRGRRRQHLMLELLERREMPANDIPTIVASGVLPPDGSVQASGHPVLQIQYSEPMAASAANASNYLLVDSSGTPVPINSAALDNTNTFVTLQYNSGQPLTVDTYTLFVFGTRVFDLDDNFPLSPGVQLIASNKNSTSVGIVSVPGDGSLGAVSNYELTGGQPPQPYAVAAGDVDGDGLPDLVIADQLGRVDVFVGRPASSGGGFHLTPDLVLNLPNGANAAKSIVLGDFDNDGNLDIAVANFSTDNVSVFLNTRPAPGTLSFGSRNDFVTDDSPIDMLVADIDGNTNKDLVIVCAVATADFNGDGKNDFVVDILGGNGNGTFNAPARILIGDVVPSGLQNPTSIALGRFDADNLDDLAVGGSNGVRLLIHTTGFNFAPQAFISTANVRSLGAGKLDAGGTTDLAAGLAGGQAQILLNDGQANFTATTFILTSIVDGRIAVGNLNGDGKDDVLLTSGISPGQVVVMANATMGGTISNATNANPIVITSANHGLSTGQKVVISGVSGNTAANGTFTITKVDNDRFSLNGSTGNGAYTGGGTWVLTDTITGATGAGVSPIVITSANHGLSTGARVTITGVGGNTNANGTFTITRVDNDKFSLNGTTGNGAYSGGGSWTTALGFNTKAYLVDDGTQGVAIVDTNEDGLADVVTANPPGHDFSVLLGNGDGTLRTAVNVSTSPNRPNGIAVGDVNKDGLADVVTFNNSPNSATTFVSILLGQPSGAFAAPQVFSPVFPGTNMRDLVSVAIGDINGDTKPDIAVVDHTDNSVGFLQNNTANGSSSLSFTALAPAPVGFQPNQIVLSDFDGDGKLDLVVPHNVSGFTGALTLRRGNGNFTFQAAVELDGQGIGLGDLTGVVLTDFNRDGFLDIAVSEDFFGSGYIDWWKGNGTGTFAYQNFFFANINTPSGLVAADFNGDSFPDIVMASTETGNFGDGIDFFPNQGGTGFGIPVNHKVYPGNGLLDVLALDLNEDGKVDIVVSTSSGKDNAFVLLGNGDGTFQDPVPYVVGNASGSPAPSHVGVTGSSTLVRITTFESGGNLVKPNLIANSGFEEKDLVGEQGNLLGWRTYDLPDNPGGSHGRWGPQISNISPLSSTIVPPPSGTYRAMLDEENLVPIFPSGFGPPQNPNPADSYSGSHALYQDVFIPANATEVTLSLSLYIDNSDSRIGSTSGNPTGQYSDTSGNPLLDFRIGADNQQVRVDIVDPAAPSILTVDPTFVFRNEFITKLNDPAVRQITITDADLTAFAGKTIRLRVAATNNRGRLIVGVDNVTVLAKFGDSTKPTLSGVGLRNPGFLGSPNGATPHTTDPTIIGTVSDNGGLKNIRFIVFDVNGDGFGGPDDVKLTSWDAGGRFTFTFNNLTPGLHTIGVQAVDRPGNVASTTVTFFLQSGNVGEWQAIGPNAIDVSNQGVDFSRVSGRVTAIQPDLGDPLGNSYFVAGANGGIWKTTNGGSGWTPLTDYINDANGKPVQVPIGGLAQSRSNPNVLYASTGLGDPAFDSRPGVGVLKSIDGGKTWVIAGNSGAALAGARTVDMLVDANDPNIAYVAVTSGGLFGPGVYRTKDGGLTWVNVLDPTKMALANGTFLPAGTALASVTDLAQDPFNSNRLLVGLGNIGLANNSFTAGVWRTINKGDTWDQIVGGDNPAVPNNTLPTGTTVGRVTIAIGGGRVGDERYVYVLMDSLAGLPGLYRTKDNMLNWTKVMLREDLPNAGTPPHNFVDIDLLATDPGVYGALAVDPANPNVVYVGGSVRNQFTRRHGFIRVDTGNMRDTTYRDFRNTIPNDGDDIDKAALAYPPVNQGGFGGFYDPPPASPSNTDPYTGEGVYWYDIATGASGATGFNMFLPPTVSDLAFDAQGRLLIGTSGGLWRGTSFGFNYDFTSGGSGILGGFGGPGGFSFQVPGMVLTNLNTNLQISDLTSVAIDPLTPNAFYTTQMETGGAGSTRPLVWVSQNLVGPVGIVNPFPHAGTVLVTNPAPGSAPGTPVTLFRSWEQSLRTEVSGDNGLNWSAVSSSGINQTNNPTRFFPAFAAKPNKVLDSGQYQDELLFGTNRVFVTRTSSAVWDPVTPNALSTRGGLISALAVAPQSSIQGVYYAGTDRGEVFVTLDHGADGMPERDTGLPVAFPGVVINGLAINPRDPTPADPNPFLTAYAMLSGTGIAGHVWRTTNGGLNWTNVSGNLPNVPAYAMVIDPRPGLGAPGGKIYVSTELGVYVSLDNANSWAPLGLGLPHVPVVDLSFSELQDTLAAATLGRGVFVISTAPISPIADQTINEDTVLSLPFSINDPGLPPGTITISATSSDTTLVPNANLVLSGSGINHTLTITPRANLFGMTNISITVSDGSFTFTRTFKLTVVSVNDLPVVSPIGNQVTTKNTPIGPLNFTVGDVETSADNLTITATVDNATLFPAGSIVIGGSGANHTLTLTPATDQVGTAIVTLHVADTDGGVTDVPIAVLVTTTVTLPFSDNFNRPDNPFLGAGWIENVGDFSVGTTMAVANTGLNVATLDGVAKADVSVQADVSVASGQFAGLVARYTGAGDKNMYFGTLNGVGNAIQGQIWRNVHGAWTMIGNGVALSGTGTLRFVVVGPSLKLFLDNTLVAFANDTSLTAPGSVGVRTGAGVTLDNFSAAVVNASGTILPFNDPFNPTPDQQLSANWVERVGNFNLQGGTATGTAALNVATLNGVSQANVFAQADVILAVNQYAGLVARYGGPSDSNMYFAALIRTGASTGQAVIWRNVGGVWTQLTGQNVTTGGTATLRFEVVGPSQKLFINGTLAAFANDTAISGPGTIGLRVSQGAAVDSFSADNLTLSNASLPFTDSFAQTGDLQLSNKWLDRVGNFSTLGDQATGKAALNVATVNGVSQADVFAQADISIAVNQYAGLVTRYGGPGDNNMYFAALVRTGASTGQAVIWRNVGGAWTQLAGANISTTGTGTLRFESVGPTLKLFLDSTLVASVSDFSISAAGTVGLRVSQGAVMDNFSAGALPQLPFSDSFSGPGSQLSSSWLVDAGGFNVAGGNVQGTTALNVATVNASSSGDDFVQADVTVPTGEFAGLIARYSGTGDKNMYFGALNHTATGFVAMIWKNVNGTWTSIINQSVSSTGTGTLRFEVVGSSLKLFLDNTLLAFAYDTSLTAPGFVGMRVSAGAVLDNFSTDQINLTNPGLPFTDTFPATLNQQLSTDWRERVGNFNVQGNAATGVTGLNVATVNGVSQVNEFAQADVTVGANQFAGLVARYSGPGDANMYFAGLVRSASTAQAVIWRNVGGTWTQIAGQNIATTGTGTLRFEVAGPSQKLFLNGTLVAYAHDTAVTAPGTVGLRIGQGASVANFSADAILLTNPTLPFNETFSSAVNQQLSTDWQERVGNFNVQGGTAAGTASLNLATVNGIAVANISVQVDVALTSGQFVGLVSRYTGAGDSNMYLGMLYNNAGNVEASIWRNVGGTWTKIATKLNVGSATGTLRFEIQGTTLRVLLDGTLLLSITDSLISAAGTVGLRTSAGAVVDNFSAA
jgi:hypothetical protein